MWFRWSSSVGNPLRSPGGGTKRWAKCAATGIGLALLPFMALTLVTDSAAVGGPLPTTLYAYATGITGVGAPSGCPTEATPTSGCSLGQTLTLANTTSGETVELETPGTSGDYDGNWALTSTAVTIEPATGVSNPILSGSGVSNDSAVLTLDDVTLSLNDVTIEDAHNTAPGPDGPSLGGAIDTYGGGVTISGSTFLDNEAAYGGAINNADGDWGLGSLGTVTVTDSTFTGNVATAGDGGAIDSSGGGGAGTLSVTGSTFQDNQAVAVVSPPPFSAITGNGGAIDNSDESGSTGTLKVTTSTFTQNVAANGGGAIDNSDNGGSGTASSPGVTFSYFYENSAGDGGAIDSGDNGGTGSLNVGSSTFETNTATYDGGAIASNDNGGKDSSVTVSSSTFYGNVATDDNGGAISNDSDYNVADGTTNGSLTISSSTLDDNSAALYGSTISNSPYGGQGTVSVAADLFDGSCDQGSVSTGWTGGADGGYNVGTDASCFATTPATTDVSSTGASILGTLYNNGGPTFANGTKTLTIKPGGGNPAIGLIPSGTASLCPATDQRGASTPAGVACDAGAIQSSVQPQTITFVPPASATVGGSSTLTATASSALPVTLSVDITSTNNACTLTGNAVTFAAAGSCVIDANQSGGTVSPVEYLPAPQVQGTITVSTGSTTTTTSPPVISGGGGGVVVTPTLTVTAPNATIFLGTAIPAFTPTYTGGTPTTPATCTTTATSASSPGVYPVTCTGAVESGFDIVYVPGTLTIVTTSPVVPPPIVPVPAPPSISHAAGSRLASNPAGTGWWILQSSGNVKGYGTAKSYGGYTAGKGKNVPVAIAATPDGKGYWLVAANGTIHTFGDAKSYGSPSNVKLATPIVGITSTPDGKGYWLVAAGGGVFNYGDAHFYGTPSKLKLATPIVGITSTPDGKGYWLVAAGGGVFNYGDAHFYGPPSKLKLATPIVGITSTPDGKGYWLVAAGGGVFNYGDAHPYGSDGGKKVTKAIVGLIPSASGTSYDLVNTAGAATHFPS